MKGTESDLVNDFLKKDLPSITKRMHKSIVPIHFVISKWDLIEDEFSLKQVRERLLEIPDFQDLIRVRNAANSPVRLIPVSSIGSGFAIPQADGGMKKILGAVPRPFQLETPLACVLPDGLQARISALQRKQAEIKENPIGTQNVLSSIVFAFSKTSQTILDVFGALSFLLPDEYQFARPVVTILSRGISYSVENYEQSLKERAENLNQERTASLKLVNDEASSLQHAVYNFAVIENKLMRNFPESELILM